MITSHEVWHVAMVTCGSSLLLWLPVGEELCLVASNHVVDDWYVAMIGMLPWLPFFALNTRRIESIFTS